jgi:hypothetical protein
MDSICDALQPFETECTIGSKYTECRGKAPFLAERGPAVLVGHLHRCFCGVG